MSNFDVRTLLSVVYLAVSHMISWIFIMVLLIEWDEYMNNLRIFPDDKPTVNTAFLNTRKTCK